MNALDRQFMEATIECARQSEGDRGDPLVGALAVANGSVLASAHRGPQDHAEFVLLEKELQLVSLAGATVYTTLEPCTVRNPDKTPCVERLIQRRVGMVVIGMLDPNPLVTGYGYWKLRSAGIRVMLADDNDLLMSLEELNRHFISGIEAEPIHNAAREILTLATRSGTPRQKAAAASVVSGAVKSLRRIRAGEIPIAGREGGYFARLLECIGQSDAPERIKAFIRLTAFEPKEVIGRSWFEAVYRQLAKAVAENKLRIEYVFLLPTATTVGPWEELLSRYRAFAEKIALLGQSDSRVNPEDLRPSIVLLQHQRIAFTHDRGEDGALLEASEWVSAADFARLGAQVERVALMSTTWYEK